MDNTLRAIINARNIDTMNRNRYKGHDRVTKCEEYVRALTYDRSSSEIFRFTGGIKIPLFLSTSGNPGISLQKM